MARKPNKKIKTRKKSLRALFRDINQGKFAIPKLQREFVWDGRKAAKLIDSIYSGMPIGIPLIWHAAKSQQLFLRRKYHILPPFNNRNKKVWFIVDGQQRISVLYNIMEGGIYKKARNKKIHFDRVVFALERDEESDVVVYRRPVEGKYIPLNKILHPHWRHKISGVNKWQLRKIEEFRERVLNYKIHLMFIEMKIKDVRECFLRINTQGMKLTSADAIFTRAEGLDLRDLVKDAREHINPEFQDMDDMPILWAIAATQGTSEARGAEIEKEIIKIQKQINKRPKLKKRFTKEWTRLLRCFGKAIDYLRTNFGVLNSDFIYSPYIISMLALFYFWKGKGPNRRQKEKIRKWFWATTIGSRYSGRSFLRCIPEDYNFFKRLAKTSKARFKFTEHVHKLDVRRAQYTRRTGISSAFYCLLVLNKPLSILEDSASPVPLERYAAKSNRKDRHHIFPRRFLYNKEVPQSEWNTICNICLLTAEENQSIGTQKPESYLDEPWYKRKLFNRKMRSHLIPRKDDSGLWESNKRGYRRFIKNRQDMICRAFEKAAGIRLFRRDS